MTRREAGWEADYTVTCSQCGGDQFVELFPVPADVLRLYRGRSTGRCRDLVAVLYACQQCGHLERFVDPAELSGETDGGQDPGCGE